MLVRYPTGEQVQNLLFSTMQPWSTCIHLNDPSLSVGAAPRQQTKAKFTKFCYEKANWKKFNKTFHDAAKNLLAPEMGRGSPRSCGPTSLKWKTMKWKSRVGYEDSAPGMPPRSCTVEKKMMKQSKLMKTEEVPGFAYFSIPSEVRQQQYRAQAVIVQQVIQSKRRATW